jgi:hypothetical protein
LIRLDNEWMFELARQMRFVEPHPKVADAIIIVV